MKIKDIANLTINRANSQVSLNLKAKQLKKIGITPQNLLELKIPKNLKLKKVPIKIELQKEVKINNGYNRRTKSTSS